MILMNGSLKILVRPRGVNGAKGPHFNVVKTGSFKKETAPTFRPGPFRDSCEG